MLVWGRLSEIISHARVCAGGCLAGLVEALRTLVEGDAEVRRKVAFSVAMIALSAKMAKADGIVTPDEVSAFNQIFSVPASEARNVARLYDLAKGDVAGFEAYAERLARLCGDGAQGGGVLEDVLDGLFHIAKADGLMHEREGSFLQRVAGIFGISAERYALLLSRHVDGGRTDPWRVLGIGSEKPFEEVRRHYRQLVASNHPDRLIARGLPEEFVAIATRRLAAINAAYETIERGLKPALEPGLKPA